MKHFKRVSILIMCLVVAFSSAAMPFYAFAAETGEHTIECALHRNPFYEGRDISTASLNGASQVASSVSKAYNSHTYYSEGKQLYKTICDNLEKRNTSFKIYFLSNSYIYNKNQIETVIDKLFKGASDDSVSVSSTDGDYVRWAVSRYGASTPDKPDARANGYYYYTLNAVFEYYDTADEEAKVDKVVNDFVSGINTNTMTDYEIIKKIHDFICSKTTYDNTAANNFEKYINYDMKAYAYLRYAYSPYGALVKGSSVCQGYALAFYRLCKELGYSVRFVSSLEHAWNIVGLDGKYYFVDATWDDNYFDGGKPESAYTYFLVNYADLRANDKKRLREELELHYLEDCYDTEYFWENYREFLDENSYDAENKSLISQSIVALSGNSFTYTGGAIKPSVKITSSGEPESYTLSYSNNVNTGRAVLNILSGENSRPLCQRCFVIIPKKMGSLSLADSGRATDSLTVKWNKAAGAITGYRLEIYKDGKWSFFKNLSASSTSCKVTSLKPSTQYMLRIRSYKTVDKKTYFGAYSNNYSNATKPKNPAASSISSKSRKITFKWKKVSCSGYEIQYGIKNSKAKPVTKTVSASSASKTISKLKKGKTYYFRVRAYKTYTNSSGQKAKCYSAWSSKKSIKCK